MEVIRTVFGDVPNHQRLAAFLYEHGRGNPGHTLDLTRLLLARAAIRYTSGTFVLAHDFARELTQEEVSAVPLARLAGLHSQARRVADLLALHTGPLDPTQISDALGAT